MDKKFISNLDIAKELVINRYMLSSLLTNVFMLLDKVEEKERRISRILKEKKLRRTMSTRTAEMVNFTMFSIRASQYRALCNEFGNEIAANACVITDTYMKKTGTTYKDPYQKIRTWGIILAMKEKLGDYTNELASKILDFDYELIDNEDQAKQYIKAMPKYMRNIDKGCKYLREKFNLEEEG